ncbi:dihydroorotate dehydrogenase (fumarate) [Plasmodium inui San Antonio 1]|uniref:Dihydroorotate dehydrogenase (quinone), mitochondrial n=1 Tax=Plasmodium inui San Antonio 1 TaxID=1237626 RepID=W7ALU8_9APIC|nr:dihydroorotate dehydrogenase (fumarate) [Plasmodium inui San Antonio 1]EUD66301.1 dihydroorotate dehydrogenase (fumarate) [Plasmodium inui San Antonio 1]
MLRHNCLRKKRYLIGGRLFKVISAQLRTASDACGGSLGSFRRIKKNDAKWYGFFEDHVIGGATFRPLRSECMRRYKLMAQVRSFSGESNYKKVGRPPGEGNQRGGHQREDDSDISRTNKSEKKKQLEEEIKKLNEQIAREKRNHKKVLLFISMCVVALYLYFESYDPEFFLYDVFLKILLNYVDEETCHDLFLLMGKYKLLPYDTGKDSIYSCSQIKGLHFVNPFGVAAGFDKNGVCIDAILKLGFSFIEIGTMTPKPQKGNDKPRIFRDIATRSIRNSCGFNNLGCDEVTKNLRRFREKQNTDKLLQRHLVGVSLGKNKDSPDILEDLSYCIARIGRYADYIAINVSSPNTPGLRDNQQSERLQGIILRVKEEVGKLDGGETVLEKEAVGKAIGKEALDGEPWVNTTKSRPLIFVKLAPDLEEGEKKKIANVLLKTEIDGMIICNTTTQKFNIKSFQNKNGGVSGEKLKDISTNLISQMYNYTNGKIPIIASGGIFTGKDALEKIEAGASVCQLYSCLVFNGMKAAVRIKRELDYLLYQRGYYKLEDAIGKAHRRDC